MGLSKVKSDYIKVKGAKMHNLKNIDLEIPKKEFIVITGQVVRFFISFRL